MPDSSNHELPDRTELMTVEEARIISALIGEAVDNLDSGDFSERGVLGALARIVREKRDFEAPFN